MTVCDKTQQATKIRFIYVFTYKYGKLNKVFF